MITASSLSPVRGGSGSRRPPLDRPSTQRRGARPLVVLFVGAVAATLVAAAPTQATPPVSGEVRATAETDPVRHSGDAADDPAIWVNRTDLSRSAVIGTDKQSGLTVYDLAGRELQYLRAGDVNNVDVRSDVDVETSFRLGDRAVSLVTAGNRSKNSIDIYTIDPQTRLLEDVATRLVVPGIRVYGSCMYRSATAGGFFVFANSKRGEVEQWELFDDGAGRVDANKVRSFSVGSPAEGCVADDELGHVYIGEESRGIWKYGAEPGDGSSRTLVARTDRRGPLVADVEGLALAYGPNGTGYLIASSQGDSSYAVYEREGDNAFVKSFRIVRGNGIDGTTDTDGIDVSTAALGPAYPHGLLVAQDGRNDGGRRQNFKLVPYESIFPR